MSRPLDCYRNEHGRIWLNVASSTSVLSDYINFDSHVFLRLVSFGAWSKNVIPKKHHDLFNAYYEARKSAFMIEHNCKKPLPLPDESADHILCSHFIEHVHPEEAKKIIADFYRVLKREGTLHVIVPDLKLMAIEYIRESQVEKNTAADTFIKKTILSTERPGSTMYRFLEFLGNYGLQHRWMYDAGSMESVVRAAGFKIESINKTPSRDYRLNDGSCHVSARKL